MIDDVVALVLLGGSSIIIALVWSFDWKFFYAELERLEREENE